MTMHVSYTEARVNLARLMDQVKEDRETVIITRHGEPEVAMIAADELASLLETTYLLRSPRNSAHLLSALARSFEDKEKPQTVEELRRKLGLDVER